MLSLIYKHSSIRFRSIIVKLYFLRRTLATTPSSTNVVLIHENILLRSSSISFDTGLPCKRGEELFGDGHQRLGSGYLDYLRCARRSVEPEKVFHFYERRCLYTFPQVLSSSYIHVRPREAAIGILLRYLVKVLSSSRQYYS